MRIQVKKWGNSAAFRMPSNVLKDVDAQIGQQFNLKIDGKRIVLEPADENLEEMLKRITPENRHGLLLENCAAGVEFW